MTPPALFVLCSCLSDVGMREGGEDELVAFCSSLSESAHILKM